MLTDLHLPTPASSVLACRTLERAVVVGTGLAIACEAALLHTLLAGPRLLQEGLALSGLFDLTNLESPGPKMLRS